jgi:hypothetical protein
MYGAASQDGLSGIRWDALFPPNSLISGPHIPTTVPRDRSPTPYKASIRTSTSGWASRVSIGPGRQTQVSYCSEMVASPRQPPVMQAL